MGHPLFKIINLINQKPRPARIRVGYLSREMEMPKQGFFLIVFTMRRE
jgi:predicted O-linked N-acetylglucosamine transferase (SPINDLY family)